MDARAMLGDLTDSMRPGANRARTVATLDDLFRRGTVPDPLPHGFLPGTLVTTSVWGPADMLVRSIADAWMPWKGKRFDADTGTGVNIIDTSARLPSRILWPGYKPERVEGDRMEMFPFRNRIAPGAIDEDVKVYKIDYDFEVNPDFIIRRILDELVQVEDGLCLGKILFRSRARWHPIGFFTLERPG